MDQQPETNKRHIQQNNIGRRTLANSVLDLVRVRTNYALGFSSQNIQQLAQLQVQFIYPELSETCNWLLRSKTLLLLIVASLVRTRCVILDDVEL